MRAAAAARRGRPSDVPVFAGLVGGSAGCPAAVVGRRPGSTCAPARRCATWRTPAEGGWNLVVGLDARRRGAARRRGGARHPGRGRPRGCSPTWRRGAALELARIEYASMAIVTLAFRARDFPDVAGLGVPGAAGRRPVGQGRDVLLRQVGLGPRGRGTDDGAAGAALLGRPAPRGAAAPAPRRRAGRSWRWPTSPTRSGCRCGRSTRTCSAGAAPCRSTPSATSTGSRRIRAAVGGPARARGLRRGVRRGRHPGLHRLRGAARPTQVARRPWRPAGE